MFYRFRDRKRWPRFLDFCKQLRRRFPTGKLFLVCDHYGPSWLPKRPRSPPISAATPNTTCPSTQRSTAPTTYPTLLDTALESPFQVRTSFIPSLRP